MLRLAPAELAKLRGLAGERQLGVAPQKTFLSLQGDPEDPKHRDVVRDYSGNRLVDVSNHSAQPMHRVDCSPCPQGSFLSRQCTVLEDRVCTACTRCPYDHFANVECEPDQDTQCKRCTVCPYNYFVAGACAGGA